MSAPLVLNAQLCEPPPPPAGKKRAGRPPEKGAHLPNLSAVLVKPTDPVGKGGSEMVRRAKAGT